MFTSVNTAPVMKQWQRISLRRSIPASSKYVVIHADYISKKPRLPVSFNSETISPDVFQVGNLNRVTLARLPPALAHEIAWVQSNMGRMRPGSIILLTTEYIEC